jgi:hypothetical protein
MKNFENQITKFVLKSVLVAVLLALGVIAVFAYQQFTCPFHPYGQCTTDGQVRYVNGQPWEHYRCTCGDSGWVKQ